jgi:hypothetical protein
VNLFVYCAALVVLMTGAAGVAAEEPATTKYRSPGDMTVEERTTMMSLVGEYNNCVYQEGVAQVDKFPDIRQAADAAMEACENTANKLRETIDGYGFEPGFAEQFVHHAQSRAARTLLPELAIRKSG